MVYRKKIYSLPTKKFKSKKFFQMKKRQWKISIYSNEVNKQPVFEYTTTTITTHLEHHTWTTWNFVDGKTTVPTLILLTNQELLLAFRKYKDWIPTIPSKLEPDECFQVTIVTSGQNTVVTLVSSFL